MKIYNDVLIDHFRNPRNRGTIQNPDFATQEYIPSCGDRISMQGIIVDSIVTHIAFQGSGCIISQAAASLLTEYVCGTSIETIEHLDANTMLSMLGIQLGPNRLQCALLSLHALQAGIQAYKKKSGTNNHAQSAETCTKTKRD